MTEITKWEYHCANSVAIANTYGKQGWEAFGARPDGTILLKRPCGRLRVIEKVNGKEINPEHNQSQDTTYER